MQADKTNEHVRQTKTQNCVAEALKKETISWGT